MRCNRSWSYGKKEQGRTVGITELSLQYYERYLNTQHPNPRNREAFAFLSKELSGRFRNVPVGLDGLRADHKFFKNNHIPKLLKRLDTPESDKKHLQFLKDTKKWHPYIMRHSSLSRLAPDISDYQLRRHAGWSNHSNMVEVYTHSRDGESAEDILLCYGVNIKGNKRKRNELLKQEMVGPHCPFCMTANIPDSRFCCKCHKPISLVSMNKLMEESNQTQQELRDMKSNQKALETKMTSVIKELIARELDFDRNSPEDIKKLNETVIRAINRSNEYFGDDYYVKAAKEAVEASNKKEQQLLLQQEQQRRGRQQQPLNDPIIYYDNDEVVVEEVE